MNIRTLLFFFFLFSFPFFSFSQGINERKIVEESFVLLKNTDEIIPFNRLDTLTLGFCSKDNSSNVFFESIKRYTSISKDISVSDLIIYSIKDSVFDMNKFEFSTEQRIVLCLFGQAKNIISNFEENNNIIAIIYSPFSDSLTLDYCGQLLFGAFGATGRLKQTLSNDFEQGAGFDSRGDIRFKYTIPAELGLDSSYIFQKIDSIANFAISIGATPGCEIFVAKNQKVFFYKSYGFHTYDSLLIVKNSDLFDLASVTKIAASAPSLMKMNQDGYFDLSEKFSKYWKPFRHSNKKDLIMLDVLCHQGKLYPWIPFWKNTLNKNKELSPKIFSKDSSRKFSLKVTDHLFINKKYQRKIFKQIKNSQLLTEQKYKYSDLSFYLYPNIVENITHQSFENYLNDNFYKKIGANTLCFNPLRYYSKNEIVPTEYDRFFRKTILHGYVHDEGAAIMGGISGHAGLFGNSNDLAKLMQMYLNFGIYGGIRYIDEPILRQWSSYQFRENGNRRGIVFDKPLLEKKERGTPSPSASDLSFGHSGFTGTFAWVDPQNGLLFIFLSNRVFPTRENKKLLKYNIRTNIHQILYDAIENSNN